MSAYRIGPDGVFELPHDENKPEVRLTAAPCGVLALSRDGAKGNWGKFICWIDHDGGVHEAAFPAGRLHERGGMLPVELANAGLPIIPGMEQKLLRYLANGNPNVRYRAATQTGWQDGAPDFVLPTEALGGEQDQERVVYQSERYSPTSQSVRTSGTFEGWKAAIAAPCIDNPLLIFGLSCAFTAPLLYLVGLEGGGFHVYGRTSCGKTTLIQVAASVWGDGSDPAEGRLTAFVRKWNLTKNATEGLAEAHNDLPLCLDEIGEADVREFGRIVYQLAGGQGKGRMRSDSTLKPHKVWRTFILSTGEMPTSDVLEAEGRRVKGGQAVRLVDIPATDQATDAGIITALHGARTEAEFADILKRACNRDFGWAGPAFVRALIDEGLETIRTELRSAFVETIDALTPEKSSAEVSRIVKRLALVAIAGEKAIALGIVPWKSGDALRAARLMRDRHLTARDGVGSDLDRGIEKVKAFILAHAASRFRKLDDEDSRIVHLAGYYGPIGHTFYFTPAGFREACGGYDSKEVARLLKARGALNAPDEGHLTERIHVPGIGRTRLYAVSADILEDAATLSGPVDRLG